MRTLLLLACSLLAACQPAAPDPRGVDRDETLADRQRHRPRRRHPDEARLQLGVQSHCRQLGGRSQPRQPRTRWPRSPHALAKLGVKPDDLQTRNLTLQRIDYGPERGRFRADNMVEVTIARHGQRRRSGRRRHRGRRQSARRGPDLRISDREAANTIGLCRRLPRRSLARRSLCRLRPTSRSRASSTIQDGGEYGAPIPLCRGPAMVERHRWHRPCAAPPPRRAVSSAAVQPRHQHARKFASRVDFALEAKVIRRRPRAPFSVW